MHEVADDVAVVQAHPRGDERRFASRRDAHVVDRDVLDQSPERALLLVRGALGGDEIFVVEAVAQLGRRQGPQHFEVETVPRQLVGHRDVARTGARCRGAIAMTSAMHSAITATTMMAVITSYEAVASISAASAKSLSVMPPWSWVESATRTLR